MTSTKYTVTWAFFGHHAGERTFTTEKEAIDYCNARTLWGNYKKQGKWLWIGTTDLYQITEEPLDTSSTMT